MVLLFRLSLRRRRGRGRRREGEGEKKGSERGGKGGGREQKKELGLTSAHFMLSILNGLSYQVTETIL